MPEISFPVRTSLTEEVTQHITNLIREGKVKPGEKLPSEREIVQQLSVSRSCVREALQALAMMRLIDIKPGRGAYVRSILPEQVIDPGVLSRLIQGDSLLELIETRRILEVEIAGLAAERRTEDDVRVLGRIIEAVRAEHITIDEIIGYDLEFHLQLAQSAHNTVLMKVYTSIFSLLTDSRSKVNLIPGARDKAWIFHGAIYDAVKAKDGVRARRVMHEHLEDVRKDVMTYVQAQREPEQTVSTVS